MSDVARLESELAVARAGEALRKAKAGKVSGAKMAALKADLRKKREAHRLAYPATTGAPANVAPAAVGVKAGVNATG